MEDGSVRAGCRVGQLLGRVETKPDRNSAKSPGIAVLCEGSLGIRQLRCRSREAGSSPKLCQTFYRRRTQVWGIDFSKVVGAELRRCEALRRGKRTEGMQNRPEVRSLKMDRAREGGYGGELERWGHPQNFVEPSIEGEQKFGGWICERWVPSSAVAAASQGRS